MGPCVAHIELFRTFDGYCRVLSNAYFFLRIRGQVSLNQRSCFFVLCRHFSFHDLSLVWVIGGRTLGAGSLASRGIGICRRDALWSPCALVLGGEAGMLTGLASSV